jgi:glycosyltransferase involved in cell wall biosynthesis
LLVSIVMINRNGGVYLREAVSTLVQNFEQCAARIQDFEFIFVDNGSTDDSVAFLETSFNQTPFRFRVIHELEAGVNSARNAGLKAARGDYLIYTDNDLQFDPGWLKSYLDAFESNQNIRIFAGRVLVGKVDGKVPEWLDLTGPFSRPSIVVRCDNGPEKMTGKVGDYSVEGPVGPNMAFHKSVFETYGVFDTRFGLRPGSLVPGAEAEFFHRLTAHNEFFCYVPGACVRHPVKKEQLSKRYFTKRMEGIGRVQGRLQALDGFDAPRFFGVKRYLVKQLFNRWLLWLLSIFSFNPRKSFSMRCDIHQIIGQMREDYDQHKRNSNRQSS